MKITLSWIKSYVPELDVPVQEFADKMTMSGTKVTGFERTDRNLSRIVVGQIVSCRRHPDAGNLTVCEVNTGRGVITCVTAASNLRPGDQAPVALAGGRVARLHGEPAPGEDGVAVRAETIRGIYSEGILCSLEELGLAREDSSPDEVYEVYVFRSEEKTGADAVAAMGLSDVIFSFEPASARKDCYRVLGIAREAAAVFGKEFRPPSVRVRTNGEPVEKFLKVSVKDGVLCPRYCARVVRNVKLGPSPYWLQRRLVSCGIRPVNNLVDITNYVMEEFGQPILAFDLESLSGHQITLTRGGDGTAFRTLDGQLRSVDSQTLMLRDAEKDIGIAGIMGGDSTKVAGDGRDIVLEAACFDGAYIRRESARLGLTTEISRRYARGLDPNYAEEGLNRACQLFDELGCGEVTEGMIDECSTVVGTKRIDFHPVWINRHLGTDMSKEEMISLLARLGFAMDEEGGAIITPVGRSDIDSEAEVAGEIARLYGYDRIPVTIPRIETTRGSFPKKMRLEMEARTLAEFHGYSQIMTYSFEDPGAYDRLRLPEDSPLRRAIRLQNPLDESMSIMRTQTMNGMLRALALNVERRHRHVRFYELANIYLPRDLSRSELPDERMQFTLASYGRDDFFSVKAVVEEFLRRVGILEPPVCERSDAPWLHPGRSARLICGGEEIGQIGEIHPLVAANYGIPVRVVTAVLDMPKIVERADFSVHYHGLNRHARVSRDLNLMVDEALPAGCAGASVRRLAGPNLERCELASCYTGEPLPAGKKSLTWRLRFQAADHDITAGEVREILAELVAGLAAEGMEIRKDSEK